MHTANYTLTPQTVRQVIKPYQKNGTRKEIASVMAFDENNTSSTAHEIQWAKSTPTSVSYTSQDLFQTLANNKVSHTQGILFHNHIQWLDHANVHSEQDEMQHQQNKTNYQSKTFEYLGSGLVSVSTAGNFHIKFRNAYNDQLGEILYNGVKAQEIVVNKQWNLVGYNLTATLDPQHNTRNTRTYTHI